MGIRYVTAIVEEEGIKVDQVFFSWSNGYMIEMCNCDNISIVAISSSCPFKPNKFGNYNNKNMTPNYSCGFMETLMMENLSMDMLNFSF